MLRDYQLRAVSELREHARERPVCCLPTGGGKTHIAAEIIRLAVARGRRALFVAHRRELILQARDRLAAFGVQAGVIMPGHPRLHRSVQVGSIQTLIRRRPTAAELVIVDEAHHAISASYTKLLQRYPAAYLIGFTATPARLDGRGLGSVFGRIVEPVTAAELVGAGHLIAPTVYAPPAPDLSGMRKRAGDFADRLELGNRMAKLTGSVVEHYRKHADGWPAVAFACNTAHSRALVDELNAAGYRWRHLDAKTPRAERAESLRMLAAGELHGLSNCDLFGEGVDVPALRCCIQARPTLSLTVHRQQIGRIMRPPGPCVVLDHAGNTHRHGLATDPVEWSLDDRAKRSGAEQPEPIRRCPECYLIVDLACRTCPDCGHEFVSDPEVPEHAAGELVGITVRAEDPREVYTELVRAASERGYAIGWARNRYRARFGKWPRYWKVEHECYTCPGHEWELAQLGPGLWMQCKRCRRRVERGAVHA